MDEQDTSQDGDGGKEEISNSSQSKDHCKRKTETVEKNTCDGDDDIKKKRLSRRMEKKKRKKEAKKRNEGNKKRKLENADGSDEHGTSGEKLSNNKLKKQENSKCKEGREKPSIVVTLKRHFKKSDLKKNPDARLKMKDIQDLMLYSLLWQSSGVSPQWCEVHNRKMIKKVIVIALRSVGEDDYLQNIDSFPYIYKEFNENVVKTQASGTDFYVHYTHDSLLNVPVSKNQLRKQMEKAKEDLKEQGDDIKSKYVLTNEQLIANEYPVKCYSNDNDRNDGYLPCVVKEAINSTDKKACVYALDCEMCLTSEGNELTRISIVDEMFNVVYNTLVMPERPIVDYKTKYSGITAECLQGVTVTLQDVQKEIQRILPSDAILAGHSLEFDLKALKMYHTRIIDTSVLFGDKRGSHFKPSLRYLAHQLLGKNIQNNSDGHCSIEDAVTVMELVKQKFEKGTLFGPVEKPTEGLFHRMDREQRKTGKLTAAMIDYPSIVKFHTTAGNHAISLVSDSEIASSAVNQINNCDFVWMHFHGAQHFYEGIRNDDLKAKKEVFKSIDSRVSEVCQAIPEDCLTIIVMGYGDVSDVIRIQKDPKPRREELRQIVSQAKKGLCFLKIT